MENDYEITGFVNFPSLNSDSIKSSDIGETLIYLIVFGKKYNNLKQKQLGKISGIDSQRISGPNLGSIQENIDFMKTYGYISSDEDLSVVSSVLIGWSRYSYNFNNQIFSNWCCEFRDLTTQGKKLFYSLKKLNNESEVRVFTFSNIK